MATGQAHAPGVAGDQNAKIPAIDRSKPPFKELRLGLVCYGGVSLAIYMHGITAELLRLVHASAEYCRDPDANPFKAGTTERIYWEALAALEKTGDRARLRVVIDVISGTSAGGINGVVLAKALTHGLRQDPLRDVWFENASILRLLRILHTNPLRLFQEGFLPPLDGAAMTRWAHDALKAMNDAKIEGLEGGLMPPDRALDLFVTTTDCSGYRRTIELYDPESVTDREHRHVLHFRYDPNDGVDQFGAEHDRALTLAIRCTSSFPGAFPPVSVAEVDKVVGEHPDDAAREAFLQHCFAPYQLEEADPEMAAFVDGGVLNNHPFDHAIRAILERPADCEVDRRLVFIEPHPVEFAQPHSINDPERQPERPSYRATIAAALSSIPRHQPVSDALVGLNRHNERAAEVRRLIRITEPEVERLIADTAGKLGRHAEDAQRLHSLELPVIEAWSTIIQDEAASRTGAAFVAYQALKIGEVVTDLADGICSIFHYPRDSRHALLVRRLVRRWAETGGLIDTDATPGPDPATIESRRDFLKVYDLNFRRRRLRFLIRYVNRHYHVASGNPDTPDRAQLDGVKKGLYDLIGLLRAIQSGRWVSADLRRDLDVIFGPRAIAELGKAGVDGERAERRLGTFLDANRDRLSAAFGALGAEFEERMQGFWSEQTAALTALLAIPLPPEFLQGMLQRYLGFAYWDAFLYPLMAISGLAELDPIEVIRISSTDTRLLDPRGVEKRLKGVSVAHFGAFFRREYRENDYLWGRLDAVERLLGILQEIAGSAGGGAAWDSSLTWRGFAAVLDAEGGNMTAKTSKELVKGLRDQVARQLAVPA